MMMVEQYKKMWVHLKAVGKNSFQTGPSVLPKRGLEKEANLSTYSEKFYNIHKAIKNTKNFSCILLIMVEHYNKNL